MVAFKFEVSIFISFHRRPQNVNQGEIRVGDAKMTRFYASQAGIPALGRKTKLNMCLKVSKNEEIG